VPSIFFGIVKGLQIMVKWNTEKHIFEHQHSEFYQCDLKDVDHPNLYKTIFPYDEVSKIDFDNRIMPIKPAKRYLYNRHYLQGWPAVETPIYSRTDTQSMENAE